MLKYLFICCLSIITTFVSFFQNKVEAKTAANQKRAANSPSTKRAAVGGGNSSSASKQKSSSKKGNSKSSKKSSSSKKSNDDESSDTTLTKELKCLNGKLTEILDGACGFLLDTEITALLGEEDFYCVYNYKDTGKISSVYNYYLGAYYGISENSIKADTSIINVKNNAKNALKYYQYLIDEINLGTLKESKILDSVTEKVLENADMDFNIENTIERKSIESVPISIDIVLSDIESCTKLTKAALSECNAVGNLTVKNKITDSCTNYNAALIKLAGAKKAEALGYDTEIIAALKQRANAEFYDYKEMVELEQEKLELQKTYDEVKNEQSVFDNKKKRAEIALKVSNLLEEIETTASEELRKSKEEILASYKRQLCNIDKIILKYDSSYTPDDDYADCNNDS